MELNYDLDETSSVHNRALFTLVILTLYLRSSADRYEELKRILDRLERVVGDVNEVRPRQFLGELRVHQFGSALHPKQCAHRHSSKPYLYLRPQLDKYPHLSPKGMRSILPFPSTQ